MSPCWLFLHVTFSSSFSSHENVGGMKDHFTRCLFLLAANQFGTETRSLELNTIAHPTNQLQSMTYSVWEPDSSFMPVLNLKAKRKISHNFMDVHRVRLEKGDFKQIAKFRLLFSTRTWLDGVAID